MATHESHIPTHVDGRFQVKDLLGTGSYGVFNFESLIYYKH